MRTRYPVEFRQSSSSWPGRSAKALAQEFEPSEQTIRISIKQADPDTGRRSDVLA